MKKQGFTMMEMTIALGIVGILVSAVAPVGFKKLDAAKLTRSNRDIAAISDAITAFHADNKRYPDKNGSNVFGLLESEGEEVGGHSYWSSSISAGNKSPMDPHLLVNGQSYPLWDAKIRKGWNGPYLQQSPKDPWGYRYKVMVLGLSSPDNTGCGNSNGCRGWVIGAGPDHDIVTDPTTTTLADGDIGILMGPSRNNL